MCGKMTGRLKLIKRIDQETYGRDNTKQSKSFILIWFPLIKLKELWPKSFFSFSKLKKSQRLDDQELYLEIKGTVLK